MTTVGSSSTSQGLSHSLLVVGAGLAVIGLGSLGFLAIVALSLDAAEFAEFGIWFGFVNVISFGLFVPMETAIASAVLSSGEFTERMRRQVVRYTATVLLAVLTFSVAFHSIVLPRLMAGSWTLVAVTLLYVTLLALQAIQRGVTVGHDRFWPLFWQFSTDGVLRLVIPVFVVALWKGSTEVFALGVVVSAASGLASGHLAVARTTERSSSSGGAAGIDRRALAALVIAAIGAQLLANGAPPLLGLIARDDSTVLAGVVGALALTRLPLLFASAVQAPLLPPMVRMIRGGYTVALWSLIRRILMAFAGLFLAAWFTGWYLGALLLRSYLGDDYGVRPISMAMLASAGVALLGVVAVQAAIVAAGASALLARSWAIGIAIFVGVMAIPRSGLIIAPSAIMLGTTVTLGTMLFGLRSVTQPLSVRLK